MKIQDIILIILTLVSVATAVWYLFWNSLTFKQTLLILIITFLFINATKLSGLNTKLNLLEKSFIHLAKDFKEHIKKKK